LHQGASHWSSSFTGPARYTSTTRSGATDDQSQPYGEPYAPYASGSSEYADPYADGEYGADAYPAGHDDAAAYGRPGAEYQADLVAPDFAVPTYLGGDYPQHTHPGHDYEEQRFTGGFDGGLPGGDADGWAQAESGHTQLLTMPRVADVLDDPRTGFPASHAPKTPGTAETPETAAFEPRSRQTRRKTGWAGRAVQGLVLASLLGGVTAYVAFEKTVTISVDGSTRQIHSFAATVGAALSSDDIATSGHDLVIPAPATSLADNSTITVKYGRPISVTVNGNPEHAWVHAPTVGAAMQELGIRIQGARFVSVTPSTPISRSGRDFALYTMRHVTFLVDGKTQPLDTTAATVQDAMAQAGIALHNQDTASVSMSSLPADGETISIMRVTGTTEVKLVSIPYTVTKQDDPSSYVGSTTVVKAGQSGVAQITYALQIVNGVKQSPKEVSRVVTKQPVAEVEKVGTKSLPTNVASLNWAALAKCESGGNPGAVDPSGTYYGLYQFSVSTWDSLGGSGLPSNASASEQTSRAELLYQRSGAGQWPVCGHFLFS
jgi:uncharacterized protein YabE (DUF348 family)